MTTINIRCVTLQHGHSLDLDIEKEYVQESRVEMGVATFIIAERIAPFDLDEIMQGEIEFRKQEEAQKKASKSETFTQALEDLKEEGDDGHIAPRNAWEEDYDVEE